MHGRALALGVVALFALPAGDALAGSASVQQGTLVFAPGKAERNLVTVTRSGASLRVVDTGAPLTPGAGCAPGASANEVLCGAAGVTALTLGGGDDRDVLRADAALPSLLGGGSEEDVLVGGSARDTLNGGQGPDRLDGRGGGDVLDGGTGVDVADYRARTEDLRVSLDGAADDGAASGHGTEGDDVRATVENVIAGAGADVLTGSAAANELSGGSGTDRLEGRLGTDVLRGGAGSDAVSYADRVAPITADLDGQADDGAASEGDLIAADVEDLSGGAGADTLTGSPGPNRLEGGAGDDELRGGDGDDVLDGGGDADLLDGEGGADTVTYAARTFPVRVFLDGLANDGRQNATGGSDEGDNAIAEAVIGSGAAAGDFLFGGIAPARFEGGPGDDVLIGGLEGDVLLGDAGKDVLSGNRGDDALRGGVGDDQLTGSDGTDVLEGEGDADVLSSGNGDDTLLGGAGADTFRLGFADFADTDDGADSVRGGDGVDRADYRHAHIPLDVRLDDLPGDGKAGEGDDVGVDVEEVLGGTAGDVLIGSPADNLLDGGKGDDFLDGRGGSDTVLGGDGEDDLFAIDGIGDALSCGAGADTFSADPFDAVGADCTP